MHSPIPAKSLNRSVCQTAGMPPLNALALSHHLPRLVLVLLPFLTTAASTIVTFSNPAYNPLATQICTSGGYPDICCIPLDITHPSHHTYR